MGLSRKEKKKDSIKSTLGITNASSESENNSDASESLQNSNPKNQLIDDNSDFDFDDDEEEEKDKVFQVLKKSNRSDRFEDDESDQEDQEEEEENLDDNDNIIDEEDMIEKERKNNVKLKKLTEEQLAKEQKKIKKTGVCYLSKIPPYMKPAKLRSVLSRFGKIDRLFLKPEDNTAYAKRVKYGGNKKKNYTAGWVEFVNKKDAKLCTSTLNGNKLGGKKTSYYYDDIINIKYLSGFKWFDLTQQIARENEIRQAKLSMELSQQQKLNKSFINNVEKSKMINNMQNKRKAREAENNDKLNSDEPEIRRTMKQRKITSTRADAKDELKQKSKPNEKLNDVLSKVF